MGLNGTVEEASLHYEEAEQLIGQLLSYPPEDPYPLFHRVREIAPIHRRPSGVWTLARYDDITLALRDPRFIRDWVDMSRRQLGPDVDLARPMLESRRWQFQQSNPPEYMRKRSVFAKFLTPAAVDELRPEVERNADALLDAAQQRGEIELVAEFSYGMTLALICKILGFPPPEGGAAQWLDWFRAFGDSFQPVVTEQILKDADTGLLKLNAMMGDRLEQMRRRPGDNLITKLMQAEYDGAPLPDDEIIANAILMFSASVGTSADLISNVIVCLMQHRDQWDLVVQDPDKYVKAAVEETLRYDTSVTVNVPSRLAAEDVEIAGVTIPAGDVVVPLFAAGNRDPERFDDPDTFDITREDIRPLSFGGGPHVCPGQHLARAEAEIALRALAARFPDMRLVNDEAPRRTTSQQRGAAHLNVRLA
ncbi:cytochrome P450 [Streptomyces plumbiresistens]|uniref:Cytochrome P450 n=1 Tax=Streptomyces plumbiresistens TaxID=511811 RepID=A0ABP7SJV0_9ACTN